jgi:hypothetical protein
MYLMFKSRRYPYRKPRRPVPIPLILGAIPLALILLELLVRILVGVTGRSAELAAYEGEPAVISAYRLKFLNQKQQAYDGLSDRGHLAAQRSLAVGYSLVGKQQSRYWRINEQGFREDDPVPLAKPKNEIRIFLLGGSAAFGQWNASNQATFANKLEARLNERIAQQRRSPEKYRPTTLPFYKPELVKALALPLQLRDGQYRVINAAVPGYASGNQLAQLALQILPYNPDAVLVLDGYTDLMLPSEQSARDIPHTDAFLDNSLGHFWTQISHQFQHSVANTYLVKAIRYWLLRPQPAATQLSIVATGTDEAVPLEQHFSADPAELKRRVARYRELHKQMVKLTTGAGIPLVIAVQPEITGRGTSKLSEKEQELLNKLGSTYTQRVQAGYAELTQANQQLQKAFPKNLTTLNLYKLYENFPERAFYDTVHLTEEANVVLAERFYRTLTSLPKLQVTPPKRPK